MADPLRWLEMFSCFKQRLKAERDVEERKAEGIGSSMHQYFCIEKGLQQSVCGFDWLP
jgi:hypothetical protein